MKNPTQSTPGILSPVEKIAVGQIVPDPKNRKDHDVAALTKLANSIAQDGLLQAIVVRPLEGGKYMIVAGERRWLAHKQLKLETIEARVAKESKGLDAVRKRAAENFHREDLTPIERAVQLQELLDDGMSQGEVAAFVGAKDQSTVSNFVRLIKLPKSVQAHLQSGALSQAHGKALLRWEKRPAVCALIAEKAITEDTSAKELERSALPFTGPLLKAGLIASFRLWRYDGLPYVITDAMKADADYVATDRHDGYCLDPKKWALEKDRQDKANAIAEAAIKKKTKETAAAGGNKLSASEAKARQKKIADNKSARQAIAETKERAIAKIRAGKGISAEPLHVVIEAALDDGRHGNRINEAAEALGIKLPKKKSGSGDGWRDLRYDYLRTLGSETCVKLAALAVMLRQSDDAHRFAGGIPEGLLLIAGQAKKGGKK